MNRLFAFMVLPMWFLGTNEAWSQEWDHEYVPFVEEGKVWNCECLMGEDTGFRNIDCVFTMNGDTLIGEHNYKKVLCEYEKFYGDKLQHYYCAVREEEHQVFLIEGNSTKENLLYDFSNPLDTVIRSYADCQYARCASIHIDGVPTNLYEFPLFKLINGEINIYYGLGFLMEGVGILDGNPFCFLLDESESILQSRLSIVSCMKGDTCYFDGEWMIFPTSARNPQMQVSTSDKLFDLQGRPIQGSPKHGVYIQNGKKVMR